MSVAVMRYAQGMTRWEPDSSGRLIEAALDLYLKQGFDNTTVAQIAERAGLTERTFFRHFSDKREVLFPGGTAFQDLATDAAKTAAIELGPLDTAMVGLGAVSELLQERRPYARKRQQVIAANSELQERELIKLQALAAGLADVLRERGVGEPSAGLVAEVAVAVFKTAFEKWVTTDDAEDLRHVLQDALGELRSLAVTP
jgi:AcrR family transcriptional regulator